MRLLVLAILAAIVLAETPAATEQPVAVEAEVEAVPVPVPVPVATPAAAEVPVPLQAVPIPASDSGASTEAVLNALSRTRQELSESLAKQSQELSASLDAVGKAQRALLKEVENQKQVGRFPLLLLNRSGVDDWFALPDPVSRHRGL
jgi:hypothetical protein